MPLRSLPAKIAPSGLTARGEMGPMERLSAFCQKSAVIRMYSAVNRIVSPAVSRSCPSGGAM